ncbi:hypothetical protein MLGJGCBP_00103 [Rhodococcus sp. T7]|nr:hypothetical protein MLGJGCBP_09182 [Rhodococcus sp. T7]KAF0966729.1 hypothetical protein MLGJGCBP_00103 [Rhodococcus sp. T7]
MKVALSHSDPLLRTCLAQQWLSPMVDKARSEGYDPDSVARAIAELDDSHPLWEPFERTMLRGFDDWPDLHTDEWAVGAHDRLISADIETVWLYDRRGKTGNLVHGDGDPYVPYLLKLGSDGWKVLNVWSEIVPVPGWPPTLR